MADGGSLIQPRVCTADASGYVAAQGAIGPGTSMAGDQLVQLKVKSCLDIDTWRLVAEFAERGRFLFSVTGSRFALWKGRTEKEPSLQVSGRRGVTENLLRILAGLWITRDVRLRVSVATVSVWVMETGFDGLDRQQKLAVMSGLLDTLLDEPVLRPTAAQEVQWLADLVRFASRVEALTEHTAAKVDAAQAVWETYGTSATTWLVQALNLAPREASRLVKAGATVSRFSVVDRAALGGTILGSQAGAIASVLTELPTDFDADTVDRAQSMMVEFAGHHHSVELRRLTNHLVEVLSPQTAEALEEKRLERLERLARGRRFLDFRPDGQGSVLIRGSLPVAQAEPFIRIVESYASAQKRALDAIDPNHDRVRPGMRRADGLLAMVHAHSQQALAPSHGGDRPRIVVTLSYDSLIKQCADAGLGAHLTRTGEPLPASVARQLLCDADLLPMVLGGRGEPLDVGRSQRLVTPPIRAALEVRDGGCVFPGCESPPEACHAHHLKPWWAGGDTALHNLALVCPHHHGIIEPSHDPTADRWRLRLRDGVPEIVPPHYVDARQCPRVHARFTTRR